MTSCAWLWIYAGLALTLLELAAPGFVLCFFGLAAASVGALRAIFGESFDATWQFAAFSVLSVLYIVLLRRMLKRVFVGDKSGAAQGFGSEYVGRKGKVTEAVNSPQNGRVMIGDAEWTAAADVPIAAGVDVEVVAQDNLTLKVRPLLALLLVAFAFVAGAEKMPYDRYTNIVERQMFGPLPDDFDPTKMPGEVSKSSSSSRKKTDAELTKAEQQLKSAISFSMINMTPEGDVKVGFTDNSDKKTPLHYYMKVGEERNGWLVKEADPETATMTIAKGEIEVTLTIGGDSAKDAGATSKAGAKKPGALNANAAPGGIRQSSLLRGNTLRARRTMKREARERTEAELAAAKQRNEELEKARAEEEAQRAAEKAEADAKREEDNQRLQKMRNELDAVRQEMKEAQKAKDAEEASEGGESENEG